MLKADLHIHTKEDPVDDVAYTAKEMIKRKAELGFNVIAITNHNSICYNQELVGYAKTLGVLLIPGMEMLVNGSEVLVLGADKTKLKCWEPGVRRYNYVSIYDSYDILNELRGQGMVIGASHPYFVAKNCLGDDLVKNIEKFDYVEFSHFYLSNFNRNKKAVNVCKKYNKPMIASTDAHWFKQLGYVNYTLIDADFNIESVLNAIKSGQVKVVTQPIKLSQFIVTGIEFLVNKCQRMIKSRI